MFAKFDLLIKYSSPYERLVWNYKQADTLFIQRTVNEFDWENAFSNIDINKKVEILKEIILNIFCNYCTSKNIFCNDNDPPWLLDRIKTLIGENALHKHFS